MTIDPGNAAALVGALANLAARDGELDLIHCNLADIATVFSVLAPWVPVALDD
jgi:hypothetical protein